MAAQRQRPIHAQFRRDFRPSALRTTPGLPGPLITWDAASAGTGTIQPIAEFRPPNGTITDGSLVVNKLACSAHVFDAHPRFRDGGLVALGHFDHGTRFVSVGSDGRMSEVGYFMPYSAQTFAARWSSDDVVYAVDLERGIDVLRVPVP